MPHQCTECGHTFPDGSKEMLSGCPDCGGNKFKFEPATDAREASAAQSADESADATAPAAPDDPAAAQPPPAADGSSDALPDGSDASTPVETEDGAQADARRDVASPDDLAAGAAPGTDDTAGNDPDAPDAVETDPSADPTDLTDDSDASDTDGADDAEMAALRQELDDQFESIKILEPGQYELNLMELYNREEFIIALQEDGQYVIDVPGSWHGE
ncbi:Zn-ribbon domain-containing protein [Halococcus qingdaonensis]|uniref:Zn-ribbon domain-containing protein n=1 Tax=Halococcus qingdaonensis TaxID=224402 RepID=UPI002116C16F|nr:Zn-ribbon domain-containing protein [Halococcus qingdaonensis]